MVSKKVLIVDDEFSIRDMLRMALEIADFECLEAENIHCLLYTSDAADE